MAHRLWRITQVFLVLEILLILGVVASCSSSGHSPLAPGGVNDFPTEAPPGLIVDAITPDGQVAGQGVLGMFKFKLDPVAQTASLEPIARANRAIGDPYAVDITGFLTSNPCLDCFRVDGVGVTPDGYVYADYRLKHPFDLPATDPPLFNDRLDLHVFDVRGIFLKPDPEAPEAMHAFVGLNGPPGAPETMVIDNSGFLAGITVDGVTGAFDEYTDTFYPTTATSHPYVMLHEDTRLTNFDSGSDNGWTDLRDPMGHNVFPMGGGPYIQRVSFTATPGDQVEYLVVLAANFASSSQGPGLALGKRANPTYYVPWANMKSPWRVKVEEKSNSLEQGDADSEARLTVSVFDWQHSLSALTVVDQFRVENQARNSMLQPSRVLGVDGDIPGIATMDSVNSGFLAGVGTPQDPLIYEVVIPNALNAPEGSYLGAIRVRDEYTSPEGALEGVGRDLNPFQLNDYSTYALFSLAVAPSGGGGVIMGEGNEVYQNNGQQNSGEQVVLDPRTSDNMGVFVRTSPPAEFVWAVVETSNFGNQSKQTAVSICQSTNGGATWGISTLAPQLPSGTSQREPSIAVVEDTFVPGLPWIHVVYASDESGDDFDIMYTRSSNFGTSWSTPVVVNTNRAGDQRRPHVSVNPFDSRQVYITWEDHGFKNAIGVARDATGSGSFGEEKMIDPRVSLNGTGERQTPKLVFPPLMAGEPNTMALVWRRANDAGPDIMTDLSTTGYAGLGSNLQSVSDEIGLKIATDPDALFVLNSTGVDFLVSYNEQTLAVAGVPFGGSQTPIYRVSSNKVKVTRRRAAQMAFDAPVTVSSEFNATSASVPVLFRIGETITSPVGVVWHDDRNRYVSGSDIFAAFSTNQGGNWGNNLLVVGTAGNQKYPSVRATADGVIRLMYRDEAREPRHVIQFRRND